MKTLKLDKGREETKDLIEKYKISEGETIKWQMLKSEHFITVFFT